MTILGQNTKSLRKKSLPNTRLPVVGVKNLKLHHEATVGEQYLDITNLTVPSGLTNPSPSEIAKMRLKDFSNNWFLTSNLRPMWMEGLSFEIISNTTVKLKDTFEAIADEVFTIQFFNHMVNGTVIADVRTPNGSGVLLEGETDVNLGEAIPIKNLTSQWPIQAFRGAAGNPQLRNENNAAYTGDDSVGNYQMVDRGDGYCQVLRFNIPGGAGGEPFMWANHGALGERPDLSVLQNVDKIHGIMDLMREDLLLLTGYDTLDPTRYEGGVPTQADIKAFGDAVYAMRARITALENLKNKTQTKILGSTTISATGVVSALCFSNLTVGKFYRLSGKVKLEAAVGGISFFTLYNNSSLAAGGDVIGAGGENGTGAGINIAVPFCFEFVATQQHVVFNYTRNGAGDNLKGDNTKGYDGSFVTLTEAPQAPDIVSTWT